MLFVVSAGSKLRKARDVRLQGAEDSTMRPHVEMETNCFAGTLMAVGLPGRLAGIGQRYTTAKRPARNTRQFAEWRKSETKEPCRTG